MDEPTRKPGADRPDRPALPRRFYREAGIEAGEGGFRLVLDGRPARTPGRAALALGTRALAEAVAAEWDAQVERIDPATMPLTRLANSAIDGVAPRRDAVVDDLVRYAGSDLVCYRAAEPEALVRAQADAWDPVLAWARDEVGALLIVGTGITFVVQPALALERLRGFIDGEPSHFALAAWHVLTTLTGSVLLALMHGAGRITAEAAWAAAHVDELYQEGLWGTDDEALRRRAGREADFRAASRVLALARSRD